MCVCVRACTRVCVRLWSSDEGPEPQGGRKAADCTPWMTPGCGPRPVFCSPAFLLGWGPSYYAIFRELLDPAFCFSSCLLPRRGLGSGPGVSSSPVQGRPSGRGQVPLPASPASAFPCPQCLWESVVCRHFGALLIIPLGPRTWKTSFFA